VFYPDAELRRLSFEVCTITKAKGYSSASGKASVSILAGLAGSFMVAALVLTVLWGEVRQNSEVGAQRLMSKVVAIRNEGFEVMEQLNAIGAEACTESLLNRMRQFQFFSQHIRDIGFVQNGHLVCSTGRGMLPTPLPEPMPDYVSKYGVKVWSGTLVQLFGQTVVATLAEKGNFNVVYDVGALEDILSPPYRWALVYRSDNLTKYIVGDRGLYRDELADSGHVTTRQNHYYAECDEHIPFCIAVQANTSGLAIQHRELLALLLSACVLAGIAAALAAERYRRWRKESGNRIRRGLIQGGFYILFQPIVDLQTRTISGCEVLARFRDRYGDIYPNEFIPEIARMNLTWQFTRVIVRQALDALEGDLSIPDGFQVNINLFPEDIGEGRVNGLVNIPGLVKSRLIFNFEITEDQALDTATARENLAWLANQGWGLAVDDFGTGYSNLSHIRDLRCDTLKIDRSFMSGIEHGGISALIVPTIVNLAAHANLRVVAEGVENEAQNEVLRHMGVSYGQGWLYGKPMDLNALSQSICGTVAERHWTQ
tara:strand:- start:254 stop:1876 length:1623 start_codon:yes stop_codon:yes gene_type:complete